MKHAHEWESELVSLNFFNGEPLLVSGGSDNSVKVCVCLFVFVYACPKDKYKCFFFLFVFVFIYVCCL